MAKFKDKEPDIDCTILGVKTRFEGVLKFSKELQIAGTFNGTIDAVGALVIKKGATCTADFVKAASIVVEGQVRGDLTAGDRIEIRGGGSVRGNLTTSRLRIADGVSFEGQVEMIRSNVDVDLFSTRPDALKEQLRVDGAY